ncbi:hypothetical protein Cgig2_023911 [Carnegiea gigantea]|uniref:Uncharacterized protein n=1 Tax=Carnegiea gigantea TaxID=171969 RepID=A0A9Q1GY54_9CARY|nr:hypothetical protein Cgig2_023911 [Carnegiea gigantea]
MYDELFVNFGGSLTDSLHHEADEVGISLYNLERIGGLPTVAAIYKEFLPLNKDLVDHNKYLATVVVLLHIHAELYKFHKVKHIYYDIWLDYYRREYLADFACGEQTDSEKEKAEAKKKSHVRISRQERMTTLNVIAEGELDAFLSFCLSHFVLPHAIGYIYHGLEEAASHLDHAGKTNIGFTSHCAIGWLAKLFRCLYHCYPDSDRPWDFPSLVCYVGLLSSKLSLLQARHIFRDGRYLSLRASPYDEDSHNGRDVIDMRLPDRDFKFLLSRMVLAQAYTDLKRQDTRAKFYIPPSYYEGVEEIFGVVETAVKIEELVDVNRVKALSDQDLACSFEIAHIEGQLNNLLIEAAKLKVKEQELLRDDEQIHKILIEVESKLESYLYLKKMEVEWLDKLQDLEKEKDHLKSLIDFVISFNNV